MNGAHDGTIRTNLTMATSFNIGQVARPSDEIDGVAHYGVTCMGGGL